jgi:hypothetical protein
MNKNIKYFESITPVKIQTRYKGFYKYFTPVKISPCQQCYILYSVSINIKGGSAIHGMLTNMEADDTKE